MEAGNCFRYKQLAVSEVPAVILEIAVKIQDSRNQIQAT